MLSEKINASEVALQPPLDSEKPKVRKINKIKIIIIIKTKKIVIYAFAFASIKKMNFKFELSKR